MVSEVVRRWSRRAQSLAFAVAFAIGLTAFVFWYLALSEPGLRAGSIPPNEIFSFQGCIFWTPIGVLVLSLLVAGIIILTTTHYRPGGYFAKLTAIWGVFIFAYGGFLTYSLYYEHPSYWPPYLWFTSEAGVSISGIGLDVFFVSLLALGLLDPAWFRLQLYWQRFASHRGLNAHKWHQASVLLILTTVLLAGTLSGLTLAATTSTVAGYASETRRDALLSAIDGKSNHVSWQAPDGDLWSAACELNVLAFLRPTVTPATASWLRTLAADQAVNGSFGTLWAAWLICKAACNCDQLDVLNVTALVSYLLTYCYNDTSGGFCDPAHNPADEPPHYMFSLFGSSQMRFDTLLFNETNLDSTYTALSILALLNRLGALNATQRQKTINWISACQHSCGGFQVSPAGSSSSWVADFYECSLYLTYFGVASVGLLGARDHINESSAVAYVDSCLFSYGRFSAISPFPFGLNNPSYESSWSDDVACDILLYMGVRALSLLDALNASTQESALTRLLQRQCLFYGPTLDITCTSYGMIQRPINSFFAAQLLHELNQTRLLDLPTPRATAAQSILHVTTITFLLIALATAVEVIILLRLAPPNLAYHPHE